MWRDQLRIGTALKVLLSLSLSLFLSLSVCLSLLPLSPLPCACMCTLHAYLVALTPLGCMSSELRRGPGHRIHIHTHPEFDRPGSAHFVTLNVDVPFFILVDTAFAYLVPRSVWLVKFFPVHFVIGIFCLHFSTRLESWGMTHSGVTLRRWRHSGRPRVLPV